MARFVVDSSLELLARRLRALGFDVASAGESTLERTLEIALADGRVAITTSARHPRRLAAAAAIVVPRGDAIASSARSSPGTSRRARALPRLRAMVLARESRGPHARVARARGGAPAAGGGARRRDQRQLSESASSRASRASV